MKKLIVIAVALAGCGGSEEPFLYAEGGWTIEIESDCVGRRVIELDVAGHWDSQDRYIPDVTAAPIEASYDDFDEVSASLDGGSSDARPGRDVRVVMTHAVNESDTEILSLMLHDDRHGEETAATFSAQILRNIPTCSDDGAAVVPERVRE